MKKYVCTVCGYVYDPAEGDPDSGIQPGTPFENIPDDWVCTVCGATKADFEQEEQGGKSQGGALIAHDPCLLLLTMSYQPLEPRLIALSYSVRK